MTKRLALDSWAGTQPHELEEQVERIIVAQGADEESPPAPRL
jgi:hypothetical protein